MLQPINQASKNINLTWSDSDLVSVKFNGKLVLDSLIAFLLHML